MSTVLIADDERNIRTTLSTTFRLEGYEVRLAEDGPAAIGAIEAGGVDLALLDLQMPGADGVEVLRRVREAGHELPVILLTAHGSIERAVEAIRLGAFDFIEKPPHSDRLLLAARNALRQARLVEENRELREQAEGRFDMIGSAPAMQRLFDTIHRTAPTQARVLILGENGTGKELVARALHRNSPRAEGPFVRVNCAAIPRELFESELFGHEKGAFTGATARRRGKFARAHRGTLFLDEVGEIPAELQAKLLRALESGEIEPVGGDRELQVDVRVLAATNRDLEASVESGEFRRDLYYRLQVVTIEAPPLRERTEDIPVLAEHFLRACCRENNAPTRTFAADALDALRGHTWPGNVRELRNVIERLVILAPGRRITAADVRDALPRSTPSVAPTGPDVTAGASTGALKDRLQEVERRLVVEALERHRWRMAATARELGLERSHLYKKLKALEIERPD